jgi:hypothetical protein
MEPTNKLRFSTTYFYAIVYNSGFSGSFKSKFSPSSVNKLKLP